MPRSRHSFGSGRKNVVSSAYIVAALRRAHYELRENGRFFGSIPECAFQRLQDLAR
jgi:hypothetical protein